MSYICVTKALDLFPNYIDMTPNYNNMSYNYIDMSPNYMDMAHNYINMSLNYMNMSYNYIDMSHNNINISHNYINMSNNYMNMSHNYIDMSHKQRCHTYITWTSHMSDRNVHLSNKDSNPFLAITSHISIKDVIQRCKKMFPAKTLHININFITHIS
jgi:hypothetical protein